MLAERVIERLKNEFAPRADLAGIFWEHEPLSATQDFQSQLPSPAEADIVVCILWARLGTRLPPNITRPDGSRYDSGTQYELETAAEAWRLTQGRPDLLVYRKTTEAMVSLADTEAAERRLAQKKALDHFLEGWCENEDGSLRAAFHPFASPVEFEAVLEVHLRRLLDRRAPPADLEDRRVSQPTWTGDSPFRGLEVFERAHAAVFFGRTREISHVLDAWRAQAVAGNPFVLVLGASGSGKSSLVRAGVLPLLTEPGVIEGVGLWRTALFVPHQSSGNLSEGLAASLLQPGALPELAADGTPAAGIACRLQEEPSAADLLVKGALSQAAAKEQSKQRLDRQPEAQLALFVDQMEEIFTLAEVTPEARRGLVIALSSLVSSGRVWVIATLRSDFYAHCDEVSGLRDLMAGSGLYHLPPPDAAGIGQIIRRPAEAAGLKFEDRRDKGERLDDVLRDAAVGRPESLPLLEFLLEQLYQRRTPEQLLTLSAYENLGGLEGAIGNRAEEIFLQQPLEVQAALFYVLRLLVTVRPEAEFAPVSQQVSFESLTTNEMRKLVKAFVEARIFVTGSTDDGNPLVGITHEALLTHWPRTRAWLAEDRAFLKFRAWLDQNAARWAQEGQDDSLLIPPGKALDQAARLLSLDHASLRPILVRFIERSMAVAQKSRKRTLWGYATAAVLVLAIAGLLVWGFQAQSENRHFLADADLREARILLQKDRADQALAYLARALRRNPESLEAQSLLTTQLLQRTWPFPIALLHNDEDRTVQFSENGRFFVMISRFGTARVYETWSLRAVGSEITLGARARILAIGGQGRLLAVATSETYRNDLVRILDARTGRPVKPSFRAEDLALMADFSPDEQWLSIAAARRVYFVSTAGDRREGMRIAAEAHVLRFSPDSRRILLLGNNSTLIFDLTTQTATREEPEHGWWAPTSRGQFQLPTPGGDFAAKASDLDFSFPPPQLSPAGFRLLFRDLKVSPLNSQFRSSSLAMEMIASLLSSTSTEWSADGQLLLARSHGNVLLWDTRTGTPIAEPWHEVEQAKFIGRSRRVVTVSEDGTIRTWDAEPVRPQRRLFLFSFPKFRAAFGNSATAARPVAFCNDGKTVVATSGRSVGFFDLRRGDIQGPLVALDREGSAFACTGGILAVATDDQVQSWEVVSGRPLPVTIHHAPSILRMQLSSDGTRLLTASEDTARIWETRTGKPLGPPLRFGSERRQYNPDPPAISVSPDGLWVATGTTEGAVMIWDSTNGKKVAGAMLHPASVVQVEFDPKLRHLSTLTTTALTAWDMETVKPIAEPFQVDGSQGGFFSPDGRRVLLAAPMQLWDLATGQVLANFDFPTFKNVLFSSDGRVIWVAAADGIWAAPVPVFSTREAEKLAGLAEFLGGYEITEENRPVPVTDPVPRRKDLRRALGSPSIESLAGNMTLWFLTEPAHRTVSPFSDLSIDEFLRSLLEEGTASAWDEAAKAFPGHPLLLRYTREPNPSPQLDDTAKFE